MINQLLSVGKRTAGSAWLKALIGASAMACFSLTPAFGQCTLNGSAAPCSLAGPLTVNTYTDTSGSSNITGSSGALTYGSPGTMTIFGAIKLVGDTSLNGTGTLTLSSGQVGTDGNVRTLTNAGGSIVGSGTIGSNGLTSQNLDLNNSATINANSSGNTLSIQGNGGSIINSGTFEATSGGILTLATSAAINNSGGNITSTGAGSTVNVHTTIQGGTLNSSSGGVLQTAAGGATLDASTAAGAITISDGSTYTDATSGTITGIAGTLNLGTSTGGTLSLQGGLKLVGDTTINAAGTGSLTLNAGQIGTDGNIRTLTNNGLIQGSGIIGSNSLTTQNLNLNNTATINANSSGNTLSIQGNGPSIVNSGTLEATGGGILTLATSAAVNNNGGNITSTGSGSTVNLNTTIQGGTLNTSSGGVMQTAVTGATLDASTHGAILLSDGSTYTAGASGSSTITNIKGALDLGTTTGSNLALGGALRLVGDTTINAATSGGSITMASAQIGTDGNIRTLTNNVLIQGSGVIGSNITTSQNLSLTNNATINANSSGNTLSIQGNGPSIVNAGTFEATGGGILTLATSAAVNNQNGTILAGTGSTVNLSGTVQGGLLTTQGTGVMQTSGTLTLDASTLGAITLTDGSTYTAGTGAATALTNITGQLNLGTSNSGTSLRVTTTGSNNGFLRLAGDTTLSGPGSVVLNGGLIGTDGNIRKLTNNVLIHGSGVIGSNTGSDFQNLSLNNTATGTINANSSGNTLSIQGNGPSIVNSGLFEATGGGTLILNTSAAVNNQNGTILAGTGSTVNVSGAVQGGLLTTQGTGVMQTSGTVTLDGNTLGAITLTDGSTYSAGTGAATALTNITGQLNLGSSNSGTSLQVTTTGTNNGFLRLVGDTTLSGPGSVVLNGGLIGTDGNIRTLTNNSLIQGTGVIGSNLGSDFENLNLNNTATGTINANSSGNTLSIQGNGPSIVNTGLFEATGGGTLLLATSNAINNNGGKITAGTGSTVNVNTTIQGGTLETLGTGLMQTSGGATLDGSTNGAITISDGSTYTAGNGPLTKILGTLNLGTSTGGTLALGGQLQLVGDTTLSGPGSVTMSGNGQIGTDGNVRTLTNNSTIQGSGFVGSNIGSLSQNLNINNNTGTILANVSGQTLTLEGTGLLTNTGTFQANAGSTLLASVGNLSSSTFSSNTLHTGTYNVYGTVASPGTIQINALGTAGGEIQNNAATILLSGLNSNLLDGGGLDALSNLSTNSGSFTIANGRNFNTPGGFTNSGTVDIGSTDLFQVNGGLSTYLQNGGTTMVDGTLTAGATDIFGGFLEGVGTVNNAVTVDGGTVAPGDPPGTLNINGLFDLTTDGDLLIGLAGLGSYDALNVEGEAELNGTLQFDLQSGFNVAAGETFFILDSTDLTGSYTVDFSGLDLAPGLTAVVETVPGDANDLELVINGTTSATPEPSTWLMFAGGLGALAAFQMARRRRKCA